MRDLAPSLTLPELTTDGAIAQMLVESAMDYAIYLLDLDGTIKSWNSGAHRIKGYTADEIIGSNFSTFFTEDAVRLGEPARALAIARSEGRFEAEGWRVRKDRTRLWASVVIDAVRNKAGEVVGFAKITRDITRSLIEHAALAEQQEKSRLFIEAAPNGMMIVDRAGTITMANAQVEAIFGYPPGGLLNKSVDTLVPEIAGAGHALMPESFAGTSLPRAMAEQRQLHGRRLDGSAVPIEIMLNPVTTKSGRIVVASVIDITKRNEVQEQLRKAETELRKQNRLLTMAEEMSHIGHWRISPKTDQVFWSDEIYQIFDLPKTFRPTIENSMTAYHPDDREEARAVIGRAISENVPYTRESRIIRPDGTIRHVVATGQSEYAADGTLVALFGILQDVTVTKEAQRERARLLERMNVATHALRVGIWDWDIATDAVCWDAIMFELYGFDAAHFEPTYAKWVASIHADDRTRADAELAQAVASGERFESEFRVVWPDAQVHSIRAVATVIRNADGSASRMVGTNWDVTEARRLAADLRATGERDCATAARLSGANQLMHMAESMAHYGHWRIDLVSSDVYWSAETCRIRGLPATYKPTIESGLAAYDPQGPDIGAIIRQASVDGKPFIYESRILRSDKTFRDVRCSGRGELSANGALIGLVGIFQDITARKDAERVRDQLTKRVSLATQSEKVGSWECDLAAKTLTWDAQMFALYGVVPSNVVPSYELWLRCVHEEDRDRVAAEFSAALTGPKAYSSTFRVVWPNGEVHCLRAQAVVLRDAQSNPIRVVGIHWDITQVRSLAEQMQEEQERLLVSERERLYEHARHWSTAFQRAVLPPALPKIAGCAFDAVYEPGSGDGQVGGDWYDAVHLADGRILVSIGDVSGSGLKAAVVVGVVRQIMRGISQLHPSPMLILDAADRALCLEYPGVYVSAWVGLIDLVTRTITYASAGHPPPLLVSVDGTVRDLDDTSTMLIGLRKGHRGQASTVQIAQGDALVLYTDGITEAGRDVIAGSRSLRAAAVAFAAAPFSHPASAIKRQVVPNGSVDDIAILVARTDCREAEQYIDRWRFDAENGDVAGTVRGKFVESLHVRGFSADACANAELVFGELIGNVVRHANHTGDVEVAVNHGGPDTVLHVLDRGGGFNHISRLPRDPYAENGRGLFLIAALTDEFTVSERPDGGSHARAVLVRSAT